MKILVTLPLNERQKERLEMNFRHLEFCYRLQNDVTEEVIRDAEGTVRLGQLTIVPASVSSVAERNNFQPTPYEPGTEEYNRVLSKLDETFSGPNLKID